MNFLKILVLLLYSKNSIQNLENFLTLSMKILVAEDNEMNQYLMSRYLAKLGWEYLVVENGLLAVDACNSASFDAILMDIDMPVLNGIEATRQIRDFNTNVPIIAITAYADDTMRSECAQSGMNAFLAKPCSREEIKEAVLECIQTSSFRKD